MARRNHSFAVDEYYHCYNRGTDKRKIFLTNQDYDYFVKSLKAYNSTIALGKLRLHDKNKTEDEVVDLLTYCLLPNHFHLVLKQKVEHGISKFMQRVGIGYSMYFNEKNKRSGNLFQGTFKSAHIETDQDLRQVISYVYLNNQVHNITDPNQFRSYLNTPFLQVRDLNSNDIDYRYMNEVVEIIKQKRMTLE